LFGLIKKIFRKSPIEIIIRGVGKATFNFEEKAWELNERPEDLTNGLDLNFCCIYGDEQGPNQKSVQALIRYINAPDLLWKYIDNRFQKKAAEDIPEITMNNFKEHFYIYSLTLSSPNEFEVGFHARNIDIFIELFIVNGLISNIEKDIGCCTL
jgi:hypothetical protein